MKETFQYFSTYHLAEKKEKEKRATIHSQKGLTEVPLKIFQTPIVSSEREVRKGEEKRGDLSFCTINVTVCIHKTKKRI